MELRMSAFVGSVILALAACAGKPARLEFRDLASSDEDLAAVLVEGCLVTKPQGGYVLYENCRVAVHPAPGEAIDVGFYGKRPPELAAGEYACVALIGNFLKMDEDSLVIGQTFGAVGLFGATGWRLLKCE